MAGFIGCERFSVGIWVVTTQPRRKLEEVEFSRKYIYICLFVIWRYMCIPQPAGGFAETTNRLKLGEAQQPSKFPTRSQNKQPGWAAVGHFGVQLEQRTCQHCAFGHVSKPKDDTKVWSNHHWWIAGLVDSPKETARQEYQEQLVWRGRN